MSFARIGDKGLREAIERAYEAAKRAGTVAEAEHLEAERRQMADRDRPVDELIETRRRSLAALPSYHLDFLERLERAEGKGQSPPLKYGLRMVRASWAAGAWWESRRAQRLGLLLARPDSGLSTALVWLGRYAADAGRVVRYLHAGQLAAVARDGGLDRYHGADLLLIDNLGAAPPGAWSEAIETLVDSYHASLSRGCWAAAHPPLGRLRARVGDAVVAHLTDRHAGGALLEDKDG